MAASGDVTIAQDDNQGSAKLHPYLVALVRWCASYIWGTTTVLLHRLITAPLPAITASKPKPRAASTDHLHPEPKVECVVLHEPETHGLDVIFVHGLYGSLGNTWRQGDWRSKYKIEPHIVPLRRPDSIPANCHRCDADKQTESINYYINNEFQIDDKLETILPKDILIAERFYNNTLFDQIEIIDNYESQNFVANLFLEESTLKDKPEVGCECDNCEVGCGCVCDKCYSLCWPKDWIKIDFPNARVISINYTSDPHLWRPLWVKESKRLRLHERAEQMTKQLLELGVGERPIIWVGHSKGGLFIKQIYCEAYEANKKNEYNSEHSNQHVVKDFYINHNIIESKSDIIDISEDKYMIDKICDNCKSDHLNNNKIGIIESMEATEIELYENNNEMKDERTLDDNEVGNEHELSSDIEGLDEQKQAGLWSNSVGFMFYSVPHRGSPLADIKMPITARSVELLEISKDCSLVLSLQERWLAAAATARPVVRSLVETCRTLMSVLWLTIVTVDSADPGIGAVCGVSVDHREICKPSSRQCQLYTELATLIRAALNKCRCDTSADS